MMKNRNAVVAEIRKNAHFDVVVIGGGASGIGAALEAALRGYRTLLLEKYDFTKGTSSKSTKLIHGGVRYLAQGDLKMVVEALKERGYLLRNAAHLVHDQTFVIPNYRWWEGPFYTIGLKFYDLLAGKYSMGRSVHLSKKNALKKLDGISSKGLKGAVLYHDGQFDDSRLGMDLLHEFFHHEGLAINYMEATGLNKDADGKISGVSARDNSTGEKFQLSSRVVLNSTGVWADEVLRMDEPGHENTIRPSQGIHIVLNKNFLPGDHALMIPKTSDGRVLFVVPWHGKIIVGTTDTPVNTTSPEPLALEQEIQFILDTASAYFNREVKRSDVLSVFAGLRPLAAPKKDESKTKEISRNHKIIVSESKLITVVGGKWTTYRKMGQDMIDSAVKIKLLKPSKSRTKEFKILERDNNSENLPFEFYGRNGDAIQELVSKDPAKAESIHQKLPYSWAETEWLCEHEMVVHLEDLLARRLRALLLNARATSEIAEKVALRIAPLLHWDEERARSEVEKFKSLAAKYILE